MTRRVLLVDDDRDFCRRFEALAGNKFKLSMAHGYRDAVSQLTRGGFDAVLLDIDLAEERTGLDLLDELRRQAPELPVIMLSGDDRVETIQGALRAGADGYTPKHCNLGVLQAQIEHNVENAMWRHHAREMESPTTMLLGSCARICQLRAEIARVARTSMRVLIRGESGCGKEIVAHEIHAASRRGHGRFISVNTAAGTDDLFDDLMFGHETGAFTGAGKTRIGRLELAGNGTLFLDEVGKINLNRQAKLLRVMEEGVFERVGGTDPVETNARFLFASNESLEDRVRAGTLYQDFFYRIREYEIVVPPLRERIEDLREIAKFLVERFCERERLSAVELDDDVLEELRSYPWPGNIRELDTVLKRALVSAPGRLSVAGVASAIARIRTDSSTADEAPLDLEAARVAWERDFISEALSRNFGNVESTAEELGVSRSTLYAKLKQHRIMDKE